MTHDNDLAANLTEAGHEDLAKALQEKQLADQLRKIDRSDLADALEAKTPTRQPTPQEAGQQFLDEVKDKLDSGWTSVPGLLDE